MSESTPDRATVEVSADFSFPAERVFDAWLNPDVARRFLFATPGGRMVEAAIDPRIGGAFRIVDRRDGVDIEHVGRYLEIDRPRRLVFEFAVPAFSAERTRVTIAFSPTAGGCRLSLTHERVLPDFEVRTGAGWRMILDALAAAIG